MKQPVCLMKASHRDTKWEDIAENWECPDCGVSKSDFEMVQV
jgi:rubredoxin